MLNAFADAAQSVVPVVRKRRVRGEGGCSGCGREEQFGDGVERV
jgi:hypothetical protein